MSKKETSDFTSDLIKSLNKDHGSRVAYNLAYDESPSPTVNARVLDVTGVASVDTLFPLM